MPRSHRCVSQVSADWGGDAMRYATIAEAQARCDAINAASTRMLPHGHPVFEVRASRDAATHARLNGRSVPLTLLAHLIEQTGAVARNTHARK